MDRVAEGHCGAGGVCAPSCAERKAEPTSIEWEAKEKSIATL